MKKRIRSLQAEFPDVEVSVSFQRDGRKHVWIGDSLGRFGLATERSARKALELATVRYRRALG